MARATPPRTSVAANALSLPAPDPWLRQFARRGVRVVLIGAVISAVVSFVFARNPLIASVYGLSITMLCWFFIDGGRLAASAWLQRHAHPGGAPASTHWPGWPVMTVIIVV